MTASIVSNVYMTNPTLKEGISIVGRIGLILMRLAALPKTS
ncbi:MAG: hypothetical protein WBE34_18215 [Candidatus Nitrosopolaris sp.]